MAYSDTTLPQFVDTTKLTPARTFTCDIHGLRKFVVLFNADINRAYCIDCFEDSLPHRTRSMI